MIRVRLIGGMQIILILLGKWNRGVLNLFLGGGNGSDKLMKLSAAFNKTLDFTHYFPDVVWHCWLENFNT